MLMYYVHVCEQARWARSAGNSAIENVCIIIIIMSTADTKGISSFLCNQDLADPSLTELHIMLTGCIQLKGS